MSDMLERACRAAVEQIGCEQVMVDDETMGRMFDAAADTPFSVNEHGLWCDWCGELIAPPHFFEDEDYEPPQQCRCGFP